MGAQFYSLLLVQQLRIKLGTHENEAVQQLSINGFRFAIPAEALRGFEASRLGGLAFFDWKQKKEMKEWKERKGDFGALSEQIRRRKA